MQSSIIIFFLVAFTASAVQGFLPVEEALQQYLSDVEDNVVDMSSTPSNSSVEDILDELKLSARFRRDAATAAETFCTHIAGPYGGRGGHMAFHEDPSNCQAVIRKIEVRAGRYVDSIQITYKLSNGKDYTAPRHGGTGGGLHTITLDVDAGERIVGIFGMKGSFLDSLGFITNFKRIFGPFGGHGGSLFVVRNCLLRGIIGRNGSLIDSLGFFCTLPKNRKP